MDTSTVWQQQRRRSSKDLASLGPRRSAWLRLQTHQGGIPSRSLPGKSHTKNDSAFTIVELLTTVLIIGILSLLVITNVSGMITQGIRAKSMGNLRQSALAFQAYANDNNQVYPPALSPPWMYALYPYVSSTTAMTAANANALLPNTPFISPGITAAFISNNTTYDSTKKQNFCYSMNIDLPLYQADQSITVNRGTNYFNPRLVTRPVETCLLMTGLSWDSGVGENVTVAGKVYNNEIQVAYVDGHVAAMSPTNVPMVQNNFSATTANVFWYGSPQH